MAASRPSPSGGRLALIGSIALLVAVDQGVKLVIARWGMGYSFSLAGDVLQYYPTVNEKMTWGGNFIEVLSVPAVAIALNVLAIVLALSAYAFYCASVEKPGKAAAFVFAVGLAGCVCGLVDRVFWGGSLDFLQVPGAFVFDVKDCYLSVSLAVFAALALAHGDAFDLRAYGSYLASRLRRDVK